MEQMAFQLAQINIGRLVAPIDAHAIAIMTFHGVVGAGRSTRMSLKPLLPSAAMMDARDMGEQSDAILRTAMRGHDGGD